MKWDRIKNFIQKQRFWLVIVLIAASVLILPYVDTNVNGFFEKDSFVLNWKNLTSSQLLRISIVLAGVFLGIITGIILLATYIGGFLIKKDVPLKFPALNLDIKWKVFDSFKIMSISIIGTAVLTALLSKSSILKSTNTEWFKIGQSSILACVLLVLVIYYVVFIYREHYKTLGFIKQGLAKKIVFTVLAYIAALPLFIAAAIVGAIITTLLGFYVEPHPISIFLVKEKNFFVIIYIWIIAGIIAPVSEELFFRGFLYPALKVRNGKVLGILLSACFFSILHLNISSILPIFVLGILFAWLYENTGSIFPSIFAHSLHNTVTLSGMLLIKDMVI
ncbi:hypothetical protein B9J78_03350 [bacterium Unc6]|nr:hypothetical protein [bacterium Unc6]